MRRIVSLLSSIRLAILLLCVLGLVSLIGVIVPQHGEIEAYIRKYGGPLARFIMINGWHHVFSSVWFVVPLALLCLNLLLCVARRTAYLLRMFSGGGNGLRGIGVAGSFALHIGLLFLIAGGMLQYYRGATQSVILLEGEKRPVGDFGFSISLKQFTIERNAEGAITNYRSDVDLTDPNDSLLCSGATMVNAPLSWKNYSLYQTTYGYLPDAFRAVFCTAVDSMGDTLFSGAIPFGLAVPLRDGNRLLLCNQFECDFVLDIENRTVGSRSHRHDNPAFRFVLVENDSAVASQWIFLKHSRQMPPALKGIAITVHRYEPAFYSGIQVKKNAGIGFVWTGLAAISLGLLAVFLFPLRRTSAPAVDTNGNHSPSS